MHVFGSSNSGHSYKVELFLALAGIQHRYIWVDLSQDRERRPKDFIEVSKFGEVPILIDDDKGYCQSNSILHYLANKYDIFNAHEDDFGQINEWLFWESNRIGFSLANYRFHLLWQKQAKSVMDYLAERMRADLTTLDKALNHKMFLVGAQLTIADISCCAYLFWLAQVNVDINDYPNIKRWLSAIKNLPKWQSPEQLLNINP